MGVGVGEGVGLGDAVGVGDGVGLGVDEGIGVGVGVGVGEEENFANQKSELLYEPATINPPSFVLIMQAISADVKL